MVRIYGVYDVYACKIMLIPYSAANFLGAAHEEGHVRLDIY
jgi:hypothetical protein